MNMTHAWVLTRRELLHWLRQPMTPVFNLMFSIMLLLMFGLLFGGAITVPGGSDYISFLIPGMLTVVMFFGLQISMDAMTQDSKQGITTRLRSMPISMVSVLTGRSWADILTAVVELVVLVIGGLLMGWRINAGVGGIVLAILLLLWFRYSMIWVGIFLGLRFRSQGATAAVLTLVWPVAFASNIFVAPETMPVWLRPVAEWNPISATATAVRDLLGSPTGITEGWLAQAAIWLAVLWPLVITAIFLPLAARSYRRLTLD